MKTAKKGTYTLNEIGAVAYKKFPGHFKNETIAANVVAHVAKRLEIEDINGKKRYKQIAASDAVRILDYMIYSYEHNPRKRPTPIEQAVRNAEKFQEPQAVTSKQLDVNNEVTIAPAKEAEEKKVEADEFEVRRKRFYTDANYFLNRAQTPGERVAIWSALSKLYGIGGNISWDLTNQDPNKAVTIKPADIQQQDKWEI